MIWTGTPMTANPVPLDSVVSESSLFPAKGAAPAVSPVREPCVNLSRLIGVGDCWRFGHLGPQQLGEIETCSGRPRVGRGPSIADSAASVWREHELFDACVDMGVSPPAGDVLADHRCA